MGTSELSRAPRLVARRPGSFHARGNDRCIRYQGRQQGCLGFQSRETPVAQSAAYDARASRQSWCRTCARSCGAWASTAMMRQLLEGVVRRAARAGEDAEGDGAEQPISSSRPTIDLDPKAVRKHLTAAEAPTLKRLRKRLAGLAEWSAAALNDSLEYARSRARRGTWQDRATAASGRDRLRRLPAH